MADIRAEVRGFVSYEQLSRLTPFSQIDRARLGLAHHKKLQDVVRDCPP